MMSDSRIVAHFLSKAIEAFARPSERRDIAATLRRVRIQSGPRAARLVLAQLSAANLDAHATRAQRVTD
jgi:hypothetical protein